MSSIEPIEATVVARPRRPALSRALPAEARITHAGSTGGHDLLILTAKTHEDVEAFIEAAATRTPRMLARSLKSATMRIELDLRSVSTTIARCGASILWPAVWERGEERYRVLVHGEQELQQLAERLIEISEVGIEQIPFGGPTSIALPRTLAELVAGLTKRQLDAFRIAVESGYYETPRRSVTGELALQMGVTRTTYEEHLRKAERRVFRRVADIIEQVPGVAEAATGRTGRPRKHPPVRR